MDAPGATIDELTPRSQPRRTTLVAAVACTVGAGAAVFLARRFAHGDIPHPGCGLKWLTSLPCPGCGGIRSLSLLAEGDWFAALAMNPLAAAATLLAFASVPLVVLDGLLNRGRAALALANGTRNRLGLWSVVSLLALNWIWLLFEGR